MLHHTLLLAGQLAIPGMVFLQGEASDFQDLGKLLIGGFVLAVGAGSPAAAGSAAANRNKRTRQIRLMNTFLRRRYRVGLLSNFLALILDPIGDCLL